MNKAIFMKTLRHQMTLKDILIFLIICVAPMFFFISMSGQATAAKSLGLEMKTELMGGYFLIYSFFWLGIVDALGAAIVCSAFVAGEASDRTLLLIATKPVTRSSLILSKFAAFALASVLHSFIAVLFAIYVWVSLLNLDQYSLIKFMSYVPTLVFHSLLLSIVFGAFATVFSVFASTRFKALIPLALLIMSFYAFIPVRDNMMSLDAYSGSVVSQIDMGHDFGNIYINLLEASGVKLIPLTQMIIGSFTGVYEVHEDGLNIDYDQNIIVPSLERTELTSLFESVVRWVLMPVFYMIIALFVFKRKDIF